MQSVNTISSNGLNLGSAQKLEVRLEKKDCNPPLVGSTENDQHQKMINMAKSDNDQHLNLWLLMKKESDQHQKMINMAKSENDQHLNLWLLMKKFKFFY